MELITEALEKNAKFFPHEVALVEINPAARPAAEMTWREYTLIEPGPEGRYRRDMTWREFDTKANRFANLLLTRNVKKGDKVGILLMNGLEWLPIYFGILKTGALAVPMNYRYTDEEIAYCADLAEVTVLIFGPEFTERVASALPRLPRVKTLFYAGEDVPAFADSSDKLGEFCSSRAPAV